MLLPLYRRVSNNWTKLSRFDNLKNVNKCQSQTLFAGWSVDLLPEYKGIPINWNIYLGPQGLEYPTLSPTSQHYPYSIKSRTQTFITFSPQNERTLSKRGVIDSNKYCDDNGSYLNSVICYKKCLLEKLKITCIPSNINIFETLSIKVCNNSEEELMMLKLFTLDFQVPRHKCRCLDPCFQSKYNFQVFSWN